MSHGHENRRPVERDRESHRLLRWYPQHWRNQHGDALLGDLLELMDASPDGHLRLGERAALAGAGVMQHLKQLRPSGRASAATLGLLATVTLTLSPLTLAVPANADSPQKDILECLPVVNLADATEASAGWSSRVEGLAEELRNAPWAEAGAECGYRIYDVVVSVQRGSDGIRRLGASMSFGPLDQPDGSNQ